jgi:glyoxylase I family protein
MSNETKVDTSASKQADNLEHALTAGELAPDAKKNAVARRAKNRVRRLNHHAYHARDVEETRHFYEDILEMPMTVFFMVPDEAATGDPMPYVHFFFEMSDASYLAFFDYPAFHDNYATFEKRTNYDHHIALEVDSDDDIEYFKQRFDEHEIDYMYIDHGVFHSMYFTDPNGLNLEFTSLPAPSYEEAMLKFEPVAHGELKKWQEVRPSVTKTLLRNREDYSS